MALIRWEPIIGLNSIQNEMNRLFDAFFDRSRQSRGAEMGRQWIPAMDLVETAEHYVVRADLPGLSEGDVNIQLEDSVLTISGERKAEHEHGEEGYYRLERAFGAFFRSLALPEGIDPDTVQAHFDRGVLEVRIPKPEQKTPRTVTITHGPERETNAIDAERGAAIA
jgi:HSP20 family protein